MVMRFVRLWLPVAIIAGGLAVIIATGGSEDGLEGGFLLIGAGLSVWLLNFMYRVSVKGERDRDREDEARAFFDEHGHWPDEPPPPRPASPERDIHRSRPDPHRPPRHPARRSRRSP
jgi:hypothetical protein